MFVFLFMLVLVAISDFFYSQKYNKVLDSWLLYFWYFDDEHCSDCFCFFFVFRILQWSRIM